ncbi:hypothetical protein L2E82_35909 [Cichorium intybus]|uniref:Uncharacterized protein n=1 Tax=Cichorium intybus TaxID=13427 RepID=A0ACB9BQ26_CICIN|nr:hypothetical protein L2E82_35909 [Cichorium intybus]
MALDEKQNEAIEAAANELARRKGVLDENLKLPHELKVAEDERYILISSLVGLLAEYGILPRVTNVAALSDSIKHRGHGASGYESEILAMQILVVISTTEAI